MDDVLQWGLGAAFAMLGLAFLLTLVRLLRGPTLPDRVIALDLFAYLAIGLTGLTTIRTGQNGYLNVALALGMFVFLSTLAFARYIERAESDEDDIP